jgi:HEAT repeat protein
LKRENSINYYFESMKMKTQIWKIWLMMLVIFGGMFVTAATAQTSLQTKILATAAQPTTDEATQKRITELITQLGDENDSVRRDTAWNLGKIADSKTAQSFIKEAAKPLIQALADKNPGVRTYAASALGKIGDLTALQPLINALEDSDPNVRLFAANALGVLGDPKAQQPLNNLLKDKDARVQKMAARVLKQIKVAAQQATQEAPKEQQTIQEGQVEETEKKQILPAKSTDTQKRIDGFITQLRDTNVRIRNSAVQHLKAIGKSTEQSLIKALEDSTPQPVVALLGDIGGVMAIKPLYKVLNEGKSNISKSAGSALGKIKSRVTSEQWNKEVQEYRDERLSRMEESRRLRTESRRLELEKEMAKRRESFLAARSRTRTRTIERPLVVQPSQVQPSPTIGKGFLLRPRNMSIPVFIIVSILGMAISSVIMSIFIRLATKIVVRYDIAFGDAWTIAFLIALITFFIRLVTAYINEPTFYVFSLISQLVVAPFIYGRMIDYGEGPIGFGKGFLIHICSIVATVVVILGTIFLCMISLRSGMR